MSITRSEMFAEYVVTILLDEAARVKPKKNFVFITDAQLKKFLDVKEVHDIDVKSLREGAQNEKVGVAEVEGGFIFYYNSSVSKSTAAVSVEAEDRIMRLSHMFHLLAGSEKADDIWSKETYDDESVIKSVLGESANMSSGPSVRIDPE